MGADYLPAFVFATTREIASAVPLTAPGATTARSAEGSTLDTSTIIKKGEQNGKAAAGTSSEKRIEATPGTTSPETPHGPTMLPTPVRHQELKTLLVGHYDASYICQGFEKGFRLGFEGKIDNVSVGRNSRSVSQNVQVALDKISGEINLGRIAGPFLSPPFDHFKCSPLALREKSTPGKYRLLHNLSFPYDLSSVNLNIPDSAAHVSYASLNDAFDIINSLGSCFLAKSDIADAFRIVPLHPSQYNLTGFKIDKGYYFDKCLPMGARSACKIFERVSDGLKFILENTYKVPHVVKVLDDFLFIGKTRESCRYGLECFRALCNKTGVPLAAHKTVNPTRSLSFLGIQMDTVTHMASIPEEKLTAYKSSLNKLEGQPGCTLRELKSLIGKLQFVCTVIPSGRCFLRRFHDLTMGKSNPNSYIKFPKWVNDDLRLWKTFLDNHNGRSTFNFRWCTDSQLLHFTTDSSKSGFGGTFRSHFIQGSFPSTWEGFNIAVHELYPIFALVHLFGKTIANSQVLFHCDNEAIVHVLNNKTSKNPTIMSILRPLILVLMHNNIVFKAKHVPGKENTICDTLSRSQVDVEFLKRHGLDRLPVTIPKHLLPHNLKL